MNAPMVPRRASCPDCRRFEESLGAPDWSKITRWIDAIDLTRPPDAILHAACASLKQTLSADRTSILLPIGNRALHILACSNQRHRGDLLIAFDLYPELVFVLERHQPLVIPDVRTSDILRPVLHLISRTPIRSITAVPSVLSGLPTILRMTSTSRRFEQHDLRMIKAANHVLQHLTDLKDLNLMEGSSWKTMLLESADLVVDVLPDGRVFRVHGEPNRVFGTPRANLLGRPIGQVDPHGIGGLAGDLISRLVEEQPTTRTDQAAIAGNQSRRARLWGMRIDSLIPFVRLAVQRVPGSQASVGQPGPAVGAEISGDRASRERQLRNNLSRNVRALENAEARIAELEEQKSRFLASAAHELKTPLTIAQSYLEILTTDLAQGLSDEQLSFIQTAYSNVQRLRKLVTDLVDLAAIEGGEISLTIERTEVVPVIESIVEELSPLAGQSGITIQHESVEGLPAARADGIRLRQVLYNLLDNALKYMPGPGAVTVASFKEGDSVVIEVRDRGIGVPEQLLKRIFDPFFRAPRPVEERTEGSGLGLAVSRRIVSALGGSISAQNRPQGGCTFRVAVPRWPECYVKPDA